MSETLKPCPFCGGSNLNKFSHYRLVAYRTVEIEKIQCLDCSAEALDAGWNRRPHPPAVPACGHKLWHRGCEGCGPFVEPVEAQPQEAGDLREAVDTSGCDHDPECVTMYEDGRMGQIQCVECQAPMEAVHSGELSAMRKELARRASTHPPHAGGEIPGGLEASAQLMDAMGYPDHATEIRRLALRVVRAHAGGRDLGVAWNALADAMHVLNHSPNEKRDAKVYQLIEQAHGIVQAALPKRADAGGSGMQGMDGSPKRVTGADAPSEGGR